jgi:predicted metal-dependent phosphoesterase TrpH
MGIADLHIHTTYSLDGTCSVSGVLKHAAYHTDLDVIAITDHDRIKGALEARELAHRYGIDVVIGAEITTKDGHLLALYIEELIPARLPLEETLYRVGLQGGICVAPHPTSMGKSGIGEARLRMALEDPDLRRVLVGVEAYNGGPLIGWSNGSAKELPARLDLAEVANSDAHVVWTIGHAATYFEGRTMDDLRWSLATCRTRAMVQDPVSPIRQSLSWLRYRTLRSLGWVVSNPNPHAPLSIHRSPS